MARAVPTGLGQNGLGPQKSALLRAPEAPTCVKVSAERQCLVKFRMA